MQLGMRWIASKGTGSLHHMSKSQMGFKAQTNPKCTSQQPKDQGNLIFAVNFKERHKARLVTDGTLTPDPVQNTYSGGVSLRHLRLVIYLGELNSLELWGADIGNAHLEAYTHEKLFMIAGAEFEELEGFILVNKALCGLKSSGKRWAERFHDIIKDMGFMPSKADPCVWMRENKELKCYEYIATYDNDLCIAAQDPGQIIQIHKEDYKLKVKVDQQDFIQLQNPSGLVHM